MCTTFSMFCNIYPYYLAIFRSSLHVIIIQNLKMSGIMMSLQAPLTIFICENTCSIEQLGSFVREKYQKSIIPSDLFSNFTLQFHSPPPPKCVFNSHQGLLYSQTHGNNPALTSWCACGSLICNEQ